ncbi:MAG: S41 family peptidase, partial [Dehalococcoidia bacterium]
GMTSILQERHTIYLRPESWVDLKDNQRPFLGYSATNIDAGRLVWLVDAGSPAATAGLKPGDVITAVNGSSLAAGSTDAPQPAVIGRTDTLSVRSIDGRTRTTRITPTRVVSPIESRVLTGGIAYLRIASFVPPGESEAFMRQLDTAMQSLAASKPIGWVVDLRSNGGGVVNLANYTAGWLGYDGVFADVDVRPDARRIRPYLTEDRFSLGGRPLVILVNGRSASSSEMLAETLHDAGIARIVGEPTAGSVRLAQYHEVGGGALQIAFADVDVGPDRTRLDRNSIIPDEIVSLNATDLANGIDAQLNRAIALIAGE